MNPKAAAFRCFALVALEPLTTMFTAEMIAELAALLLIANDDRTGKQIARIAELEAIKAANATVDVCATLRSEMTSVSSFVTA